MNKFDELGDIVEDVSPVQENEEFYNLSRIKELKCQYNLIFGKRSNGKTYSVLKEIIENYAKTGQQGAYLRRYREDFIGKRGQQMFSALASHWRRWNTTSQLATLILLLLSLMSL